MVILLWVAVVVVAANILLGAFMLIRFRAENPRRAEARHRWSREGERLHGHYWRAG